MDEVLLRFPHLGEQIFQSLDFENLSNCTRVSKCWDNFIFENEKVVGFQSLIEIIQNNCGKRPKHLKELLYKVYGAAPGQVQSLKIQEGGGQFISYFRFRGRGTSGPDGKLALVALNMLRDAHVSRHHLHLVLVFGLPVRVFHLLGEHEVQLEQEHSPLSALSDQFLGVPYFCMNLRFDVLESSF